MKLLKTILLFLFIMTMTSQTRQEVDVCEEDSKTFYNYTITSDTPNTIFYWYIDGVYYPGQTLSIDWSEFRPGVHTISVFGTAGGCRSSSVSYQVSIDECSTIYIPNAFTPDADGINDTWFPIGTGWEWIEVQVFDRWGILIFESTDIDGQWIGNFKGGEYYVQNDVYEYKVTWKGHKREPETLFGHVTVVR